MARACRRLLASVPVLVVLSGCYKPASIVIPPNVLAISVDSSGAIALNKRPIDMDTLDQALEEAKASGKEIWYYRENPGGEPSPAALAVFEKIAAHEIPISLSTTPDFAHYVDQHGNSRLRPGATPASGINFSMKW